MTNRPAPCDEPWRAVYPFQSREIRLAGRRWHYLDEGRGPVVLLMHGNPTWSFYWRRLILAWRSHCRVVAVDQLGCGLSDAPPPGGYRLEARIEQLRRLIEALGLESITLVGHDWGGAIGLGAATREPSRFARLVLMNTAAFRGGPLPLRIRVCRTPFAGRLAVQGGNAFLRAALRMAVANRRALGPAERAGYLAPYRTWARREAIYRFVEDIPTSPAHPSYAALTAIEEALPRLAALPTCLVWGMRDWCFTPWFLDRFGAFFPAAEVHRLAQAGHWLVEDAPAEVQAAIEGFWRRHPLSAERANAAAAAGEAPRR